MKTKVKISKNELLFYIYFTIMLFVKGIGLTDGLIYKSLIIIASVIALARIAIGKYTKLQHILIIALLLTSSIVLIHSKNQGLVFCILLIISMKGVPLRRAGKVGFIVWGICYFFTVVCNIAIIPSGDYVIHSKLGLGYIIRWALGYSHPNVLFVAYIALIMYYLLSTSKEVNIYHFVLISLLGAAFIFLYSISITGSLMYITLILLILFLEYNRRHRRSRGPAEYALIISILPASLFISLALPFMLTGRAYNLFNRAMSTRPDMTRFFYYEYGITLFGTDFSQLSAINDTRTLDCSYANLLHCGGIIAFIIVIILLILTIVGCLLEPPSWQNSVKIAIVLTCVIGAISEPFAFNTSFKNVSLLVIGNELFTITNRGKCISSNEELSILSILPIRYKQINDNKYITHPKIIINIHNFFRNIGHKIATNKLRLLIFAACAAIISCFAASFTTMPKIVYTTADKVDWNENDTFIYINNNEITEMENDPNIWVLNYEGPQEAMMSFSGNITKLEIIRFYVSCSALGTIIAVVLFSMFTRNSNRN